MQHQQSGRLAESERVCRGILAQDPHHPYALQLLAILAGQVGKIDLAIELTQSAITSNPNEAFFHSNLAKYLIDAGHYEDARLAACRAISLNPGNADAFLNRGIALQALGRGDEAATDYQRAIQLQPAMAKAYANLSNIYKDAGQIDEAVTCLRKAVAVAPDLSSAHSNLVYNLILDPKQDAGNIYREHCLWNRHHAMPLAHFIQPHINDRLPHRRLRVGYVSPDFFEHVVGFNLLPLFREHDHSQFEIYCYACVSHPDALTQRFQALCDVWRPVAGLSDEQLSAQIREDRIDILVDLTLHLTHNRLRMFARKPAPVQVTFAGYPGTTGVDAIDYRLTDPYLDPPGMSESHYSEKTIRLPHSFWCYDPHTSAASTDTGPPPSLANGLITFGCLNNFCKVNSETIRLWSNVLAAVPNSHLLLLAPEGDHRRRAVEQFNIQGITADRIMFTRHLPRAEYFNMYRRIDIGLDTLPYNGHTTSLDSLWMGVPVVTLVGHTVVGRAGLSQ
ncbi:MAG TPA: tetratricopeptide repeat protein, partial [Phycisphaerae bacterium]